MAGRECAQTVPLERQYKTDHPLLTKENTMNNLDATQKFGLPARSEDRIPTAPADAANGNAAPPVEDENGRWLTRGPAGDWYFYDGNAWVMTNPPESAGAVADLHHQSEAPTPARRATLMVVLGYTSAIVALFFLPPLFGLLGMYFGSRAKKQGDQRRGRVVIITSRVCLVVGGIFGVIVYLATHH